MLNHDTPLKAVTPLAGNGAGACLCDGVKVGPQTGDVRTSPALPRLRGTSVSAAWGAAAHAGDVYQPTSRIQFEFTTQMVPGAPGTLGPHPAREPEPV